MHVMGIITPERWQVLGAHGLFEGVIAVKFVHAVWLGRDGEQRFRREGSLLGQLNHPNIARLLVTPPLRARRISSWAMSCMCKAITLPRAWL
jgi:hypothetical protein